MIKRLITRSEMWKDEGDINWPTVGLDGEVMWGVGTSTSVFHPVGTAWHPGLLEQTICARGAVWGILKSSTEAVRGLSTQYLIVILTESGEMLKTKKKRGAVAEEYLEKGRNFEKSIGEV
ncbi:hypothetical protein PHLCEN_2v6221 [Hermanssonia centrifuga]|uniref:Uncharacterized protein n=1 Tax=Hermanssonia centrifuga TaxID=98765 RepID=A0A2R6P038_9APHY|nr:hypothetical protein PHLCEN_2v6221 [Hermanssonia centrifuga]